MIVKLYSLHQNPLWSMANPRLLGPSPVLIYRPGGASEFAFLISSQVLCTAGIELTVWSHCSSSSIPLSKVPTKMGLWKKTGRQSSNDLCMFSEKEYNYHTQSWFTQFFQFISISEWCFYLLFIYPCWKRGVKGNIHQSSNNKNWVQQQLHCDMVLHELLLVTKV